MLYETETDLLQQNMAKFKVIIQTNKITNIIKEWRSGHDICPQSEGVTVQFILGHLVDILHIFKIYQTLRANTHFQHTNANMGPFPLKNIGFKLPPHTIKVHTVLCRLY